MFRCRLKQQSLIDCQEAVSQGIADHVERQVLSGAAEAEATAMLSVSKVVDVRVFIQDAVEAGWSEGEAATASALPRKKCIKTRRASIWRNRGIVAYRNLTIHSSVTSSCAASPPIFVLTTAWSLWPKHSGSGSLRWEPRPPTSCWQSMGKRLLREL